MSSLASVTKLTNVNNCVYLDSQVCILQIIAVKLIMLGTYMHPYDCSSCNTQLCDLDLHVTGFGVATVLKSKFLVLMDAFDGVQRVHTFKCSRCNVFMQSSVSLTFVHGPVIFVLYFQYCLLD